MVRPIWILVAALAMGVVLSFYFSSIVPRRAAISPEQFKTLKRGSSFNEARSALGEPNKRVSLGSGFVCTWSNTRYEAVLAFGAEGVTSGGLFVDKVINNKSEYLLSQDGVLSLADGN
jgi:hypothetical protein